MTSEFSVSFESRRGELAKRGKFVSILRQNPHSGMVRSNTLGAVLHHAMTAQMNDTCFHRKIEYSIAGISGSGLFDPADLGLKTFGFSSACWRGYVAGYTLTENQLLLTRLQLGLAPADLRRATEIFGPPAERSDGFIFQNLGRPVPYTGGLLLADGFITELYVHMGFHPAWKYQEVRELIFDQGCLIADEDRSGQMTKVREKISSKEQLRPTAKAGPEEIERWIEECFSRKY